MISTVVARGAELTKDAVLIQQQVDFERQCCVCSCQSKSVPE